MSLCVRCKGTKMLCGRPQCPLLIQMYARQNIADSLIDNELIGESPSVFVGSYNYPKWVWLDPDMKKSMGY